MTEPQLEPWRAAWRTAIAPHLPAKGLAALRDALAADDPALCQGTTVQPIIPDFQWFADAPAEAACAIGFCIWRDGGVPKTSRAVSRAFCDFSRTIADAKTPGAPESWAFVEWFDAAPRAEMLRELLPEVDRELARRADLPATAA